MTVLVITVSHEFLGRGYQDIKSKSVIMCIHILFVNMLAQKGPASFHRGWNYSFAIHSRLLLRHCSYCHSWSSPRRSQVRFSSNLVFITTSQCRHLSTSFKMLHGQIDLFSSNHRHVSSPCFHLERLLLLCRRLGFGRASFLLLVLFPRQESLETGHGRCTSNGCSVCHGVVLFTAGVM